MLPCALHVKFTCAKATSMQGEDSCLCCGKRACCSKAVEAEAYASAAVQVLVIPATVWQGAYSRCSTLHVMAALACRSALGWTPTSCKGSRVGTAGLPSCLRPVGHC